jgi:hypothetical protein
MKYFMKKSSFIALILIPLILCSCKKSDDDEISRKNLPEKLSSAGDMAVEAMKATLTNWVATNKENLGTNFQSPQDIQKISYAVKNGWTNEVALETAAAGAVFTRLLKQGEIPGILKGEHGECSSDQIDSVISNKEVIITYPTRLTFRVLKGGEINTNNYIFIKQSKNDEWKLEKAWQADSSGQTIKEWVVK